MSLKQQDQILLLRASSFEIMFLRCAATYNTEDQTFLFKNKYVDVNLFDRYLQKNKDVHCKTNFNNYFRYSQNYLRAYFKQMQDIAAIKLSRDQLAVVSGIILMSRDRPNLIEPARIDKIQEKLIAILKNLIHLELPNDNLAAMRKLHASLRLLQPVQQLHREHCIFTCYFREQNPEVQLPVLFKELFNQTDYISVNLPSIGQGLAVLRQNEQNFITTNNVNKDSKKQIKNVSKTSVNVSNSSGLGSCESSENDDSNTKDGITSSSGSGSSASNSSNDNISDNENQQKISSNEVALSSSVKRKQSTPTASGSVSPNNQGPSNNGVHQLSPLPLGTLESTQPPAKKQHVVEELLDQNQNQAQPQDHQNNYLPPQNFDLLSNPNAEHYKPPQTLSYNEINYDPNHVYNNYNNLNNNDHQQLLGGHNNLLANQQLSNLNMYGMTGLENVSNQLGQLGHFSGSWSHGFGNSDQENNNF